MKKKNLTPSEDIKINLNRALRFLSFRPRSEKEIRDYLKVKNQKSKIKIDDKIIDSIVEKLKEQKFINDEEFAKWWIEQRTLIKPRAWRIIKFELKNKGISEEVIESLEFRVQNDGEIAIKLAGKKISRYKNLPKQEVYQKLGRYLSSKGFNWEIIKKSIDEVYSKEYN